MRSRKRLLTEITMLGKTNTFEVSTSCRSPKNNWRKYPRKKLRTPRGIICLNCTLNFCVTNDCINSCKGDLERLRMCQGLLFEICVVLCAKREIIMNIRPQRIIIYVKDRSCITNHIICILPYFYSLQSYCIY